MESMFWKVVTIAGIGVVALAILGVLAALVAPRIRAMRGRRQGAPRPPTAMPGWLTTYVLLLSYLLANAALLALGVVTEMAKHGGIRWWAFGFLFVPLVYAAIGLYRTRDRNKVGVTPLPPNNLFRRLFEGNPTLGDVRISQFGLWTLIVAGGLPVTAFFLLPASILLVIRLIVAVVLLLILAQIIATKCFVEIPGTPEPHRGIYEWMGARTDTELPEGLVFLVGLAESVYTVNMKKRSLMVDIGEVIVKGNARMRARLQVPWQPDRDRLAEFVQVGEDKGIGNLAADYVKVTTRDFLIKAPKWKIKKRKVLQIVGVDRGRLRREPQTEDYQLEPWEDVLTMRLRLFTELSKAITATAMSREDMLRDGCADRFHWGIRFLDIAIPTLVPIGRTQEAADERATEAAQRDGKIFEAVTQASTAYQLMDQASLSGVTLGFEDALRMVMEFEATREGHGFAIPGISRTLETIAKQFFAARERRQP